MFRNYLKIGIRQLLKHKGYSTINILGLAIGIACFVLILIYVQDERSYDSYHEKADRIYRIHELIEGAEESASVPFPVGETLVAENPDIVLARTRFFNMQAPTVSFVYDPEADQPVRFDESRFFYTDSTVFDVFDFEVLRGDANTALAEPNVIMLTESTAKKYFGDDDPIGRTLRMEAQQTIDFEVVGITADTPRNSHFGFDLLASMSTLNQFSEEGSFQSDNWYWNPAWTYILLAENITPEQVETRFPGMVEQYFPDVLKPVTSMYLMPLTDIHLHSNIDFEIRPNSNVAYVYIFTIIAVFVLLIACINFMNLSTARSSQRALEVGVRKSVGAYRTQLVWQFLSESLIAAFLAALVAVPIILLGLPALESVADKNLSISVLTEPWLLLVLIAVPVVVGIFSGLYPAFVLSAFEPAPVMKGTHGSRPARAGVWLRKGLVASQFAVSIILIAGTIVAYRQVEFMQNKQLGFDKEQVIMLNIQLTPLWEQYSSFKSEAERNPNVVSLTMLEDVPGSKYQTNNYLPEGRQDPIQFPRLQVHDDFVKTLGMEVVAGREYSQDFPADSSSAIMINESMVQRLGWASPDEAIGRIISTPEAGDLVPREVIGVVEDFHYASLHNEIGPFVLQRYWGSLNMTFFGRYLAIRIRPGDVDQTLSFLEDLWGRYVNTRTFDYFFLDEQLDQLYKGEATLRTVATAFSILAILVACLGLLGMAAFSAERRRKEIGVRKVMGSTVANIVVLLSRESIYLVGLAFLISAPLAYFALDTWLESFSYHTRAGVWPFLSAGIVVLIVAWLTVSVQAMKAAQLDPVESLRHE